MDVNKIEQLLADHFLNKYAATPRRSKKLYASDLGSEGCKRELYRKLRGYPVKSRTAGVALMFQQGENLEEQMADAIAEALVQTGEWTLVDTQTSVEFCGVTGRLDILLRNTQSGDLFVLEVKSKRGAAFKFLNEPKENNRLQTTFYIEGTGASGGILIYVDREGQNFIRPFYVERDRKGTLEAIDAGELLLDDDYYPPGVGAVLTRNENKGDDSLYLGYPWQVTWCQDRGCPCKKEIGFLPDGKIIAKAKKNAAGKYTKITPTLPEYDKFMTQVMNLSQKQGWLA